MEVWEMEQRISLPLEAKIVLSQDRIRQWYEHYHGDVYVSVSGGLDSTALLHLVRSVYPDVPGAFVDTGLEFPENRAFVRTLENIEWLRPKMPFNQVIEQYGYPVVSKETAQAIYEVQHSLSHTKTWHKRMYGDSTRTDKSGKIAEKWKYLLTAPFKISHKCCKVMKKDPAARYERATGRKPFLGITSGESRNRRTAYLKHGCNAYDSKRPRSTPMAFWTKEDVWAYIRQNNIPYSAAYDMGYERTGCVFCAFGCHMEGKPGRFVRLKKTHPQLWNYCIHQLGMGVVLDYVGVDYGGTEQLELGVE